MAEFNFDFCPNSRVSTIITPDDPTIQDMNGWDYAPEPILPFRRKFRVILNGLRWYISNGTLDTTTNPTQNAGRLEAFYFTHRKHKPFNFQHEYLGTLECRFETKVDLPAAIEDSDGQLGPFEVMLVHHNPVY